MSRSLLFLFAALLACVLAFETKESTKIQHEQIQHPIETPESHDSLHPRDKRWGMWGMRPWGMRPWGMGPWGMGGMGWGMGWPMMGMWGR